ncbi:fluoride efflux transporter CrcB [Marinactinospora thermotolerans]|uniref:Fluoride-specific ion channel FluC n=1 Tax=Marinactinospora thermotolerans DSM 45154 TaxID=1122192 RepID=A0A1T4T159_9ACTN|nr:fluoride efflux transporter CrcB [Marinactinospora thermotolerans]SKA34216.1 CrcB protein [Marinactinospora thermotolerans DSM 45154]
MSVLLVAVGAAVGAPLRYLVSRFVQARHDSAFPWGTHVVNVVGCLLIGMVGALTLPGWGMVLVVTGFLGAFTTYSTFAYETFQLAVGRRFLLAVINAAVTVAAGMGAFVLGEAIVRALTG